MGKSAAVAELGKSFESFVTCDFEINPAFGELFSGSLEPRELVMQLEVIAGQSIIPGKTLLFFDEVQESPRAISSLRYFREKLPALHVIAAGSLLEFALGEISFPVGRVEYAYAFPLSFREFLVGTEREKMVPFIPQPLISTKSPPSAIAKKLHAALREYMLVGGMPEAVRVYAESRSFLETTRIHDRIIKSFRDDIPKYVSGDLQKINISNLFSRTPRFCGQQVVYTKLIDDDPKRSKVSIAQLKKSMVLTIVHSSSAASLPLGAFRDEKSFKPIFLDIGLAQRACGRSPSEILNHPQLVSALDGQLAEQYVGQQLLAESCGSEAGELFFWRRHAKSSSAEVDYLLSRNGKVVPLEIKNGKSGSLKSLHLLLESTPTIERAVCLQDTEKVSDVGKVRFAPLFSLL